MPAEFRKTWAEERQDIVNDYRAEHPDQQDWTMEDVAGWAIRNDRWTPPSRSAIKMCASELAKASREEFYTDPQGRRVRLKHARRQTVMVDGSPRQLVFWEDIRNAKPSHMRVSLQQRRTSILADNAQLKRDADSYNDYNPHGAHIQLSFDYTEDLAELESSAEYGDFDAEDDGDSDDDGGSPVQA
jgi:hypothetical protein